LKRDLACGINAVDALIRQAPERVIRLWTSGGDRADALADRARSAGIAVERAAVQRLDRLADGVSHQGVVAEFRPGRAPTESDLSAMVNQAGSAALVLALDRVQDPRNLGACLRSAAAAGATAVVVPRDRSATLTPAARRAAAGAAETVPLVEVANLARVIATLRDAGAWSTGLAAEAGIDLYDVDLTGPAVLVVGGEADGLRRLTRARCDRLARIPIAATIESLNASAAAAIALFEVVRQRRRA
jgi:23S rRNA (guanosine2251-2'-O)-methyltransferase